MARYYFDIHDEDGVETDSIGCEFAHLSMAEREAAKAVAEISWDALRAKKKGSIAIIVRDELGPALEVVSAFHVRSLRN